jgi:hypothetical protein
VPQQQKDATFADLRPTRTCRGTRLANPLDRNSHGLFIILEEDKAKRLQQLEDLVQRHFLTRTLGRGRGGGPRLGRLKITVERIESV